MLISRERDLSREVNIVMGEGRVEPEAFEHEFRNRVKHEAVKSIMRLDARNPMRDVFSQALSILDLGKIEKIVSRETGHIMHVIVGNRFVSSCVLASHRAS